MSVHGTKGKFIEYWGRGETGPIAFQKEFDTKIYWPRLKELTKKYNIEYEPGKVVPTDDDELDAIWQAGKELLLDVGILNVNTERRITFTEDEVDEALENLPTEVTLGEGKDAITIPHRGFEDYDSGPTPVGVMGRILGPISDDLYEKIALSYAQEPLVTYTHFQGVKEKINGIPIKPGSPFEMMAEIQHVSTVKDVLRRVGRPGYPDGGSTPVNLRAEMAAANPLWGVGKGDVRHVYIMPQLKTDYDQMCRAYFWHQYGANIWGILQSYIGGAAGGPATSAVNGVADLLAYVMLYEPTILGTWPTDALYFSNSSKYALYVANYGGAAFQKHTHFPALVGAAWQMTAGIGSEEYFWETAAGAIGSATLGFLVAGGTGHQSAGLDHACGLGARFAAEVGRAVGKARLTRQQANDLVNRILPKYQPLIDNRTLHTKGGDFREVYDLTTIQPKPEYLAIYNKVKAELREIGLPIK
ncbi:putative monomethylamine methyltransferase MtmB [Selenomonas ruminantium subsp. lactilytica TAM6421]|uniref:Putative monomethylamine methyltransferase MtmB n=1 Tax=Selenomonas ruminantium subsp. lactilytica (strain NBRC 103574 / TAM6421) TaxID=927704 RepID=I0GUP1_SELRL|nr:monomethylamine:corrinoid methyltransferase [Selenomonas ruminantium]BAL84478.1 putative monomethylamine methyltransferase MtmB [Selenomonas ruminantium subsp. lactilytica TAM6421]